MIKTKGWTRVTQEFVTKDDENIQVGASLGYFSEFMIGTAWFAELSLSELGPEKKE